MQSSFYTSDELAQLGLKAYGEDVLISRYARLYSPENISLGSHVRIDDYAVLSVSNSLKIGSYVHIGVYVSIIGAGDIVISDFCGLSGRVSLYSSCDDFSGEYLTNPTVDSKYTNVQSAPIMIGKHTVIGCGSVIMPGVTIGEGVSIGAMSLVIRDCKPNFIYVGNPLKKMVEKSTNYKILETEFLKIKKSNR